MRKVIEEFLSHISNNQIKTRVLLLEASVIFFLILLNPDSQIMMQLACQLICSLQYFAVFHPIRMTVDRTPFYCVLLL